MELRLDLDVVAEAFAEERPEEVECVRLYATRMLEELAMNQRKGNRPGWTGMTPEQAVQEVFWHAAKLAVATRTLTSGSDFGEARRRDASWATKFTVREYAADVGNCAMMLLDVLSLLEPDGAGPLRGEGR